MAQHNRSIDEIKADLQANIEDLPVGIQSGGLPTNGGNKPLAEANIQPPKKSLSGREIGLMLAEALERFGAGFQGKEDPVAKRKDRQTRLSQEQQKIDLLEAANRFKAAESLLRGGILARKEGLDLNMIARFYVPQLRELADVDIDEESFIEMFSNDKSVAVLNSLFDPNGLGGVMPPIDPQIARKILSNDNLLKQFMARAEKIGGQSGVQEVIKLREGGAEIKTGQDLVSKTKFGQFMTDSQRLNLGIETTVTAQERQKRQPELTPLEKLQQGRARATDPQTKEEFTKRINKLIEPKPERLQLSVLEKLQKGRDRATDKKAIEEFNKRITKLTETPTSDIGELSAALNAAVKARDVVIGTPDEAKVEKTIRAIVKKLDEELSAEAGTNEPIDVEFQNLGKETPSQGPRTLEEFKRLRGIP